MMGWLRLGEGNLSSLKCYIHAYHVWNQSFSRIGSMGIKADKGEIYA